MPQPDVKLNIGLGSIAANGTWSPPQGGGTATWIQARELGNGGSQNDWNPSEWSVPSAYGFFYTGMDPDHPDKDGGEIDIPNQTTDFVWTVGPQSNDAISHIRCTDEASTNHYSISAPDNKGVITITESPHDADQDHFYVWGYAKSGSTTGPVVMCDPIIRNR